MRRPTEGEILKTAAVVVAAPRYMGAFAAAIGIMIVGYYPWFAHMEIWSGAAMALLEGWAIAFVFRQWRGMPVKSLQWWVLLLLQVALMLTLPIVAAPYLVSSQLGEPVKAIIDPFSLWAWSLLVAAIAPLVLAAVGYADAQPRPVEIVDDSLEMIQIKYNNAGFVYLAQRDDGIYKIGRTNNVNKRLKDLQRDYEQGFSLVQAFVVPDQYEFENIALTLTEQYHFAEPGHSELRKMTSEQIEQFIAKFAAYCFANEIPKEDTVRTNSNFTCQACGKTFAKVQGLNAHRRHCATATNGKSKEKIITPVS